MIYSTSGALPARAELGMRYVYVVAKHADGPIKVGIASNPRRRVGDLENANGQRFALVWLSDPNRLSREIEAEVHACMRAIRLLGEWFDAPFDFAVTLARDVSLGRQRSRTRFSAAA